MCGAGRPPTSPGRSPRRPAAGPRPPRVPRLAQPPGDTCRQLGPPRGVGRGPCDVPVEEGGPLAPLRLGGPSYPDPFNPHPFGLRPERSNAGSLPVLYPIVEGVGRRPVGLEVVTAAPAVLAAKGDLAVAPGAVRGPRLGYDVVTGHHLADEEDDAEDNHDDRPEGLEGRVALVAGGEQEEGEIHRPGDSVVRSGCARSHYYREADARHGRSGGGGGCGSDRGSVIGRGPARPASETSSPRVAWYGPRR